ncbi:MAG TPA: PQQ-binding-like beta-propeller repeat protein, partial [Pyrinomonadaceae bacterium]|nr:PQQ-binding-like beta-propeller repeat protein [Pyrinomonadaceae bacterium]
TPIPGLGHSSPIVWKDRIFVTTAISSDANSEFVHGLTDTGASADDSSKHSWRVYCLDKNTGRIIWEKTLYEGVPKVKRHVKASHANPTPATDGKHLVVSFGSEGLYCFDLDGKLLWKQDLGILDGGWSSDAGSHWGFGSSPVIYKHLAIVQCDTQNQSFIAAFNLADGKRVWQTAREEDSSWSTPTIYESKDRAELITSGTKYYRGYDPLTGKEQWRMADGVDVKIPTPLATNDLYFLGGGGTNGRRTFYAVRAGVKGEIKPGEAGIAWQSVQIKPHIVTPIVYGDYLYVCTDNGILSQYKITTGEPGFRARLGTGGSFSASPVAANGKVYFASEDGDVFVIKAGPTFELLARNPVGEVMIATPAIADKMIIIRGQHHVFGIGKKD